MGDHNHSHGHGHGCDGDNNHDETPEMGVQYSLYTKIDIDSLQCLNEAVEDSGKTVFKPWEDRLSIDKACNFILTYLHYFTVALL